MELATLLLFSVVLVVCIVFHIPILAALAIGYLIFFAYARLKKHTVRQILHMSLLGIMSVKNMVLIFILIGMITALWRAAGTIPAVVCYASRLIQPSVFILMTFLLNCAVSFLIGTSFGTAATMGAITMTMARTLDISPALVGGAMLAGVYFGDRGSPVSSSALLVAELTGTNIFKNVAGMMRTAAVPFGAACVLYLAAGFLAPPGGGQAVDVRSLFETGFRLGLLPMLPAVLILGCSLFRLNVRLTLLAGILSAALIAVFYQGMEPARLLIITVMGYRAPNQEIAAMMDGGGIISMVRVVAIVTISSSFSGIFQGTGLLNQLEDRVAAFSARTSPYSALLLTTAVSSLITCNQMLTVLLGNQICHKLFPDKEQLAIGLEDSAIIIPPLVPWSIAGAVPLACVGAPTVSILAAFYLYLIPLWRVILQGRKKASREQPAHRS